MLLSEAVKPLFRDGVLLHQHTLDSCPVCDGVNWRMLFVLRGFQHHQCKSCGFIFVNPRLDDEGSRTYYNSDYYRHYCVNNEQPVNEVCGPYCRTFGEALPSFVGYLRGLCPRGRVVDVGCGLGGLLGMLSPMEYERVGVEYNESAANFARQRYGLRIVGSLDDLAAEQSSFDLLTAVEVIEHVADPAATMKTLAGLLKPGGFLVITTPNIDSLDYRLYRDRCGHFCAPSHVNFFGLRTLTALAGRAGLQRSSHRYRGGVVNPVQWWRSRGTELDFWSPEVPTRNSGNVVYRSRATGDFTKPRHQALDAVVGASPRRPLARRLLAGILRRSLEMFFSQTQMIAVFRKSSA